MSEESDSEDRVATDLEDGLAEYDSEEYDSEENNEFLDLEADESDDDDDSSLGDTELFFFPQFKRLPYELCEHIWRFFDPYLKSEARVFDLELSESPVMFLESASLAEQTAPARGMLATHRESRAIALKSYPDTLNLYRRGGILRYNSATDVINFGGRCTVGSALLETVMSLIKNPSHLAFSNLSERLLSSATEPPPNTASKLKSIYLTRDSYLHPKRAQKWCVSDSVHCFDRQWAEESEIPDVYNVVSQRFCWPNLQKHREFAKQSVHPRVFCIPGGFEVWPLIEFIWEDGLNRYRKIEAAVSTGGEGGDKWLSDTESEDESTTEDEYESEGIDDATIDEEGSSSDENDLVVQSGSEDDDASSFDGFSPLQDENQKLQLGDEVRVGNFSSLEPESPAHDGGELEHATSDEEPVVKVNRRKRRIVSSDDEHDSGDERNEIRKVPSRPSKRSRIVLSDTEDEDNEVVEEGDKSQDDESSEEGDESEDEEPVKAKPMSIFEKLRRFREEVPVPPDSGSDSDAGDSMDNEDFGRGSRYGYLDDDEDDEDEAIEDDRMIAGMSESGEEEEW